VARTINRLSHRKVETLKQPGMYGDGAGLYLQVTEGSDGTPRKSWLFRYAVAGRERQMGLGPSSDVPLAEARDRALAARELRRAGKDPITEREVAKNCRRVARSLHRPSNRGRGYQRTAWLDRSRHRSSQE
jgi:hypothetical protein